MWRAMVLRGLRSCHEILGLSPQASKEELRLRYHELARCLHPDACPTRANAQETFAELAEAYAACLRLIQAKPTPGRTLGPNPWNSPAARRPWMKPARPGNPTGSPTMASQGHFRWRVWNPSGATTTQAKNTYQGQPWKWRIKGPLTISAQKKAKGFLRR
ncbi:dnaJ [Symbiodinium natans]|uniref:DnaJ protein n=1 Tax=Symbiodinium natans TaxID=878477 RepID=A0A812RTI8_9DINO|nr:dnaJ [Symbiodinium natans]